MSYTSEQHNLLINKRTHDNRVVREDSIDTRLDMKFRERERERSHEYIRSRVYEWESEGQITVGRLQTTWRKTVEGGRGLELECCSNLTCAFLIISLSQGRS